MTFTHLQKIAAESGYILYVMPVLLLLAMTVIFERTFYLERKLRHGRRIISLITESGSRLNENTLTSLVKNSKPPFSDVILTVSSCLRQKQSRDATSHFAEESLMQSITATDRDLWFLDTLVTLAPLLGLLGTIIGMFNAFTVLNHPHTHATQITGGIAEALVATASGLIVAIVSMVFYNRLGEQARLLAHQLEIVQKSLVNRIELDNISNEQETLDDSVQEHENIRSLQYAIS